MTHAPLAQWGRAAELQATATYLSEHLYVVDVLPNEEAVA